MVYTINKIAKMTGITLRTLRHFDQIGLFQPSGRSETGYRLYSSEDLETLQQILFFRELDFPLSKIKSLMNLPGFDRQAALERQLTFLQQRAGRYLSLAKLARNTIANMKGEIMMKEEELFTGFDYDLVMLEQKQYEEEVKARWGDQDSYKISKKRTSRYTKADWSQIFREQETNMQELAACYAEALPVDHPRMQTVVESARMYINQYFYPCSPTMMKCLGKGYVSDERFKAFYDKISPGLAEYYNQAIQQS